MRSSRASTILRSGLLLLWAATAHATNYYVATNGSGNFTTISQVNAYNFQGGDTVFFRRGDTWTLTTLTLAGATGNVTPIDHTHRLVVDAYGAGAKPVLDNFHDVPNWNSAGSWTNVGSNHWQYSLGSYTAPSRLWIDKNDGQGLRERREARDVDHLSVIEPWTCVNDKAYFYVYSTVIPSSAGWLSMKCGDKGVGGLQNTVAISRGHVVIRNLKIQGSHTGFLFSGVLHQVIDSCDVGDMNIHGCQSTGGADSVEIKNCLWDSRDTLKHSWEAGGGDGEGFMLQNGSYWKIHNNRIGNWRHDGIWVGGGDREPTGYTQGIEVYDNEFFHDGDYGRPLTVQGKNPYCDHFRFYRNYVHGWASASHLSVQKISVYYNVFDTVWGSKFQGDPLGHAYWEVGYSGNNYQGMFFDTGGNLNETNRDSIVIVNNVFAHAAEAALNLQWYGIRVWYFQLRNNIFIHNGYRQRPGQIAPGCDFTFDGTNVQHGTYTNNIFNTDNSAQITYRWYQDGDSGHFISANAFNGYNGENSDVISNNTSANSLIGSDYKIPSNSPAKDAGVNLGITSDYFGNSVPYNSITDIGVYEYGSTTPEEPPVASGNRFPFRKP